MADLGIEAALLSIEVGKGEPDKITQGPIESIFYLILCSKISVKLPAYRFLD